MAVKKHLEINPDHTIGDTRSAKAEADQKDKTVKVRLSNFYFKGLAK